jgi:hypothetical protein
MDNHEASDQKATVTLELTLLLKYRQASTTEEAMFHRCPSISKRHLHPLEGQAMFEHGT